MAKLYTKNTWVDETLAGAELYNISGSATNLANVDIKLATAVTVTGSLVNASRMNNLEVGVDALDNALISGTFTPNTPTYPALNSYYVTGSHATLRTEFITGSYATLTGLYAPIAAASTQVMGHTSTNAPTGTSYANSVILSTTESFVYVPWGQNGTISNLFIYSQGSPGVGQTYTATLRSNLSDTAVTCQITSGFNTASDITHSASVTAGHRWSVKFVVSGGAVLTDFAFSFKFTPS